MSTWRPTGHSRDPRPVTDTFDGMARRMGAPSGRALGAVFGRWEELVGGAIAAHATPRSLRDGTLVVEVDEPGWATQLRFMSGDLLTRLRAVTDDDAELERIEVRVSRPPLRR